MTVSGLSKQGIFNMFPLTLKWYIILSDNKYYTEIDGVGMSSPLGIKLANISLCCYWK